MKDLDNITFGNDFLDTIPKVQYMKEESVSWTSLKLKTALQKTLSRE